MWENKPVQGTQETHQWDELRSLILRMWAFSSCLWPQFVSNGCKWLPRLTDSWEADHIGCTGEVWFVNEPLRTWVNRVIGKILLWKKKFNSWNRYCFHCKHASTLICISQMNRLNGSQNCFELYIHEWDWIYVSSSRVNNSLSVSDSNTLSICTDFD